MIKKIIEKLFGVDELRQQAQEEAAKAVEAKIYAEKSKKEEKLKKMSPKERATSLGEPWISVLDVKVNSENPKNGFFELDWNEHFIAQLKGAGYRGETDEEIVDDWFRNLCRDIGNEESINMDRRGSGFINVNNIGDGKAEIS